MFGLKRQLEKTSVWIRVEVIVFNATFNHISATQMYIEAVSFIGGRNRSIRRKTSTSCKSLTNYHIILYLVRLAKGFELTTLVLLNMYRFCPSKLITTAATLKEPGACLKKDKSVRLSQD